MSSTYVCSCCFLNRISSLRNTPESSWELINQETHSYSPRCQKDFKTTSLSWPKSHKVRAKIHPVSNKARSDTSNLDCVSASLVKFDSDVLEGEVRNFMYPERLVNNLKKFQSSETFTLEESNMSLLTVGSKFWRPTSVAEPRGKTEFLAEQIDCMLQEQRQFLKELELPIIDEGGFRLKNNHLIEVQVTNEGDSIKVNRKITSKSNQKRGRNKQKPRSARFTDEAVYFASGDQDNLSNVKERKNISDDSLYGSLLNSDEVEQFKKHKKPKDNLKEEPVKLSKKMGLAVPLKPSFNFNEDPSTEKNTSVKMIFCPDGDLKCSTSSIESLEEVKSITTTSSAYVTAVNSYNEESRQFNTGTNKNLYTIVGSSSNLSLNVTSSFSREGLERE